MSGLSRREFLKVGIAAGGALWVGVGHTDELTPAEPAEGILNPWVRLQTDGTAVIVIDKSEMGQGVVLGLAMVLAEELDLDWTRVRTEFAPVARIYRNRKHRVQSTGGSTSLSSSWDNLRRVGAASRALLVKAAAHQWGVAEADCATHAGAVLHTASGRRLAYHALLLDAARLPVVESTPKAPSQYRLIGTSPPRPDIPAKIRGAATFGIDVRRPGMVYATVVHAPVFGANLVNLDAAAALASPGVRQVFDIGGAIAVVADTSWQALRGAALVRCSWQGGTSEGLNSDDLAARWEALAAQEGEEARSLGKAVAVLERDDVHVLNAVYRLPYMAHATMEPMNCTVELTSARCDVWVPTQSQSVSQAVAARICGLPRDQVHIHTTFLGGGFGRRSQTDFVAQAVRIAQRVGAPVQLIWSREEDIQHDFYRPASYHVLRAALNKKGVVEAWFHRLVCPPVLPQAVAAATPALLPDWLPDSWQAGMGSLAGWMLSRHGDPTATAGAADLPYAIPNLQVEHIIDDPGVPVGMWRAVGNSHNGFVVESFIDEIAAARGTDPLALRRQLLRDQPRHLRVLNTLAEKSGWPLARQAGSGHGIALHESFGSCVAQMAEVRVIEGRWQVTRVVCVIECGRVVHPDNVVAQMQSGILFGLGAALQGAITLRGGRVEQSNFADFPLLRSRAAPSIDVHLIASDAPPSGVGETGVPPIAAAVANALFDATRKRLRSLPLDIDGLPV